MKGIFVVEKNRLDVLELPEPEIGPYDVLVEVLACGICNSTDWKILEGDFQSGSFPILLGHESVGRVIEAGEKVEHFKLGDMVLRSYLRDDQIPSPGGRSRWGGFVQRAIVTDLWAQKGAGTIHRQQVVPGHIDPVHAVAMITLKENIDCLESTDVKAGQSLAIVGTGPVAQALVFCAHLMGISPVVAFGRRPEWKDRFEALGADAYVTGSDYPPIVDDVMSRGGFDRAIEAVGSRDALSRCLEVLSDKGRVNLYGVPPESEPYREQETSDSRVFCAEVLEARAHERLLDWIDEGKVDLSEWISDSYPWTDYERAFSLVKDKKANKAALTF
jgi:D-arabinose 1-dehydrogenase-like Zn-dependent alcohol dehydrogenase